MRTPLAAALAWGALALASPLAATPPALVVGNEPSGTPNAGAGGSGAPLTLVDVSRPATTTGNLTQVKIGWTGFPCSSVVRIKVFHRSGSTIAPTAQSAALSLITPDAHSIFTIALSPALPIQEGDLIGLTTLTGCGNPVAYHGFPTVGYHYYNSDVQGPVSFDNPVQHSSDQLALSAAGDTTQYTAFVVPGVGSLAGANGAHFKTSLQIVAPPFGGDVSGRLVYHPIGISGSATDPSIALTLGAGRAASYPDFVATLGQSGIGSLDVVLEAASGRPVVFARVFNDAGAAGTSGLGESAVDVTQNGFLAGSLVVPGGCIGVLSAPIDPSKVRLNLGMRSLGTNATVSFTLKDVTGAVRATGHEDLQPNEFLQVAATDVFGVAPGANDYIEVAVSGGGVIVYGAGTDNTTNDPAAQFVTPTACVA